MSPIRRLLMLVVVFAIALVLPVSAEADFGFVPDSTGVTASNEDGTIDTLAGSHPDTLTVRFELKRTPDGATEGGQLRNVIVKLPSGLVGDPRAVPSCSPQDFEAEGEKCPSSTQIGVLYANLTDGAGRVAGPLYNLTPPRGSASEFGFKAVGFISRQFVSVRSEEGYGVSVDAVNAPLETTGIEAKIWGVPASPEHDLERGILNFGGTTPEPVPSGTALVPYLTLPASCDGTAPKSTIEVDTVQEPDHYLSETVEAVDAGGNPAPMTGCEAVPFDPAASLRPTGSSASSATGLSFQLSLPDDNLLNPAAGAIAETEPRKMRIALPAGLTVNPSVAVGIGMCSEAQYHAEQIEMATGGGCPESSKIGDVIAQSPLIEEQVEGSLYLAAPYANPFDTLLGVYLVARAKDRGVLVKQAGRIDLDQGTGQITATFDGLPPLPYASLRVQLREGARSSLVTPSTCGSYQSQVALTPFSVQGDSEAKILTSSFQVEHGVDGGPCPDGVLPFQPSLTAGSVNNEAGQYSPLYLRIERRDDEQEITGFSTLLPPGLTGNLTGIPFCDEAAIRHAREQSGAEAQTSPACPAASQIGHSIAEAGVGSVLAQTPGDLYLGGPYEGAPLSIVSITAAKVGPFDLGTVVLHLPLNIDPTTAQVSIPSGPADQIPHIIKGVVVHLRAINVWVDRSDFTLNPTNCQPMSLTGTVDGAGLNLASPADDTSATSSSRYQLADCASLGFRPTLQISTSGHTSKANGASLTVKVSQKRGEANIHKVDLTLPKILPARLTTLQQACTEAQFNTNPAGCPPGSFIGTAKAITPILSAPLAGPAILVSHGGAAFPDVVFLLQANERGADIRIDLDGKTDIEQGITYSRFETIPDAPISSFETNLSEGPHSVLAATGNLCASKLAIPTALTGQNGAQVNQSTSVTVTGCPKTKVLTRAQKLALSLKACHKKPKGKKRASCERAARKQYGPLKKAKKKPRKK